MGRNKNHIIGLRYDNGTEIDKLIQNSKTFKVPFNKIIEEILKETTEETIINAIMKLQTKK